MYCRIYGNCALVLVLTAGAASADTVAASFFVSTSFCQNRTASCVLDEGNLAFIQNTHHFSSTSTLDGKTVTSVFDGAASAHAVFGSLGTSASLTLTDYRDNSYQVLGSGTPDAVAGTAELTDYLTILGGSGNGLLHLSFQASGFGNDTAPFTGGATAAQAFFGVGPDVDQG